MVAYFVPRFWPIPVGLFVIGWVFQFVGHGFEGKPPEFFKDIASCSSACDGGSPRSAGGLTDGRVHAAAFLRRRHRGRAPYRAQLARLVKQPPLGDEWLHEMRRRRLPHRLSNRQGARRPHQP